MLSKNRFKNRFFCEEKIKNSFFYHQSNLSIHLNITDPTKVTPSPLHRSENRTKANQLFDPLIDVTESPKPAIGRSTVPSVHVLIDLLTESTPNTSTVGAESEDVLVVKRAAVCHNTES